MTTVDFDQLLQPVRNVFRTDRLPAVLYHYTDTVGLLGIAQTNAVWATNALFLNDEGEIRHTRDLVNRLCAREIDREGTPKDREDVGWTVRDFIHRARHLNETGWSAVDAYVTCFCETDDLLSQWRGYGDRGGGFSIGFKPHIVAEIAKRTLADLHATFGPVSYDEEVQFRQIEDTYNAVCASLRQRVRGIRREESDPEARSHSEALLQKILSYAPFFKQSTFREEQEWRLVVAGTITDNRLQFRPHALGPIPYIAVRLGDLPSDDAIGSVRIGPRRDHALAHRSLSMLFHERKVEISSSEVSLR